jgi:hypothetical protein
MNVRRGADGDQPAADGEGMYNCWHSWLTLTGLFHLLDLVEGGSTQASSSLNVKHESPESTRLHSGETIVCNNVPMTVVATPGLLPAWL